MNKEAILHNISSNYTYPLDKNTTLIKIRVKKNDMKKVNLKYIDKYKFNYGDRNWRTTEMEKVVTDQFYDYFEKNLPFDMISMNYYFELENDAETLYYGGYVFFTDENNPIRFNIPTVAEDDVFNVPLWAKDAIVYQIFPDRFNKSNNYNSNKKFDSWDSKVTPKSNLGGNILGIIEKFDYLKELGINTLYLTPIFKSNSNHKYDIDDYYEIDSDFGTKEDLKNLVNLCHQNNIRVILDSVFNHCGPNFFAFEDVVKNGEKSKYKDWFEIDSFPVKVERNPNYKTFGHYYKMPKLMQKNPETAEYFIDVAEYWIRELDIDGWRFDVADEVSHSFWRKLRDRLKKLKEDILLIAEIWYLSVPWLNGDQFDTVMNYPFLWCIGEFFAKKSITPEEFSNKLGLLRGEYKIQAYNILWNMIGTHDVSRFLFEAGEDINKIKLASLFLMTYTGTPFIYYGDEIGMTGGGDPDNRRGMKWDDINYDLLEHYKKLIKIRKEKNLLRDGNLTDVLIDNKNNVYGFKRFNNKEEILIYINNGDSDYSINLNCKQKDLITNNIYQKQLILKPNQGIILEKA